MAEAATREYACPTWGTLHSDLLAITCRVKEITHAVSVATVRVNGGATCTCRARLKGKVPLKEVSEQLAANVGKLMEEILRHAVDAQSVLREHKGREAARDSAYGSRDSTMLRGYPVQETTQSEKPEDDAETRDSDSHVSVRLWAAHQGQDMKKLNTGDLPRCLGEAHKAVVSILTDDTALNMWFHQLPCLIRLSMRSPTPTSSIQNLQICSQSNDAE